MDFRLRFHFAEFAAFFRELLSSCPSVPLFFREEERNRSYFGSSRLSFVRSGPVREKSLIIWDIMRDIMIEGKEKPKEDRPTDISELIYIYERI